MLKKHRVALNTIYAVEYQRFRKQQDWVDFLRGYHEYIKNNGGLKLPKE